MINKDFFSALAEFERDKGISEKVFLDALAAALTSAYKKQYEGETGIVRIETNESEGSIRFFLTHTVVEGDEPQEGEMTLEAAQKIKKNAQIGDEIAVEFVPKDFSRIAAQTTKQVVFQRIHETERDNTLSEFADKEGELMIGLVRKVDAKNVYIELGKGQIEGLMLPQDQVPGERYNTGDRIKVYVKRVRSGGRMAQVLVSRSAPGLVKRLFEEEVPEIKQGTVLIKSVSREAGHRTKMAIASTDSRIDPVGACVGNKGSRVNAVVQELGGEKVDIILWSENPLEFIAKALSPATVISVTQVGEKSAVAVVPDDKLSLAIGRDGQNARLAARLTGWKIDVRSESAAERMEREAAAREAAEAAALDAAQDALEDTLSAMPAAEEIPAAEAGERIEPVEKAPVEEGGEE